VSYHHAPLSPPPLRHLFLPHHHLHRYRTRRYTRERERGQKGGGTEVARNEDKGFETTTF
jgi:hypothetical protein